jgi:transposase
MEKQKQIASSIVCEIKCKTRRIFSAKEKFQIMLEGLRVEDSIAGLCHKPGIYENNYSNWGKDYLDAGKKRLSGGHRTQCFYFRSNLSKGSSTKEEVQ